jgi:hypothetical protein
MMLAIFTALAELIVAPDHLDPFDAQIDRVSLRSAANRLATTSEWCRAA